MTREEFIVETDRSLREQPENWERDRRRPGVARLQHKHTRITIEKYWERGKTMYLVEFPEDGVPIMSIHNVLPGFNARLFWELKQPEIERENFLTRFTGY